ncbi:MAG: peptidoglycan DD-metalloendopeptidase family protein [Actinomycetota bacterium]|nr:peptidoglycan DD-metalloendopeptidase family protein [Actinomycetota bacterium]
MRAIALFLTIALLGGSPAGAQDAQAPLPPLTFPVAGEASFVDTFGAPRPGGRAHQGTDIFAEKLTPVVAAADGLVAHTGRGGRAGYYAVVEHLDGSRSLYIHLNDDTPGTDDGRGEPFAPGIEEGMAVQAGTVIGYVGDSGNAESTPPHLHFELHLPDGTVLNPYPFLTGSDPGLRPRTEGTTLVGHLDPGGGFNAGLWVFEGTVYLGSGGAPTRCPSHGVRIIDATDPAAPSLVGSLAAGEEFPGTSTDEVWVGRIERGGFEGEVAVVGVGLCDAGKAGRHQDLFRGLALYDLGDSGRPQLLSTLSTGPRSQGVLSLSVAERADGRVLAAVTVPNSFFHEGRGDTRLIDLTDPRHPRELSAWDVRRDAPAAMRNRLLAEHGAEALPAQMATFAEGGRHLLVAQWDAGAMLLDVSDPARPSLISRTPGQNVYSGWFDPAHRLVAQNEKVLSLGPQPSWGHQRLFDVSDPDHPVEIGSFATEHARGDGEGILQDGLYAVHEGVRRGELQYIAWHSDGVLIVDLTDPARPRQVASFVPPPIPDPQGYWVAPDGSEAFPFARGVHPQGELVYLSDVNSGLWIFLGPQLAGAGSRGD